MTHHERPCVHTSPWTACDLENRFRLAHPALVRPSSAASPRSPAAPSSMSVPRSAVMLPKSPRCAASTACQPKRVASTRSYAVGVPPRWTWPRMTGRASLPRRCSSSTASRLPIPAKRSWPYWSIVALLVRHRALGGVGALGDADDRELLAAGEALLDHLDQVVDLEVAARAGRCRARRRPCRTPGRSSRHAGP